MLNYWKCIFLSSLFVHMTYSLVTDSFENYYPYAIRHTDFGIQLKDITLSTTGEIIGVG